MHPHDKLINQTKTWLCNIVIAHTLCPFAKREYDHDRIHYEVMEATDLERQLEHIIRHCRALDNNIDRETSLLIFPASLHKFENYLDMVDIANALLKDQGYEGIYQLASFHPEYCFADAIPDDPANYTNRSPYPMLHILREASIEAALASFPDPESIPQSNIRLTRTLGLSVMQKLLADCYK